MKLNQAWGWLMVGVLAAGLNASYHDGELRWAHRCAERVGHSAGAVFALASGRADQFLADARFLALRQQTASSASSEDLARVEDRVKGQVADHIPVSLSEAARFSEKSSAVSDAILERKNSIAARNQARNDIRLAKLEAQRDLMQAQRDRRQAQLTARIARLEWVASPAGSHCIPDTFRPVPADALKHLACLRQRSSFRVSLPQLPDVQVPEVHVEVGSPHPL